MLNQLAAARSSRAHVDPTYSPHFWISRRAIWSWTCDLVTLQPLGFTVRLATIPGSSDTRVQEGRTFGANAERAHERR